MDAIEFLIQQHLEVESLFDQFESAAGRPGRTKVRLCWKMGDLLAVHTMIEETIFYPAARDALAANLPDGALEEHLWVKWIAADLVELDEVNEQVAAMMADLRERKKRHADEEEKELFSRVRELLAVARLEELGRRMEKMADELMDAGPRKQIPNEVERAPRTSLETCGVDIRRAARKSHGAA
jgi:hypothetical protein